jgi:glycosyltransferase 2 family protein
LKEFYIFIISLILIILLVLWIGPLNIYNSLKTANWAFIFLAVIIHLVAIWVRSLRWGFIIDQPKKFRKNYIVKTIGLFAGNFSPMRAAGELLNAIAGKKINKISISKGLSAGLTERFFDLTIAGLLLILASFYIPKIHLIALIGGSLTLGIVFIVFLINWRKDISLWIYEKIHPIICRLPINEGKLGNLYNNFTNTIINMTKYTNSFSCFKNLMIVLILSSISWILECARLYTVLYAFNFHISFLSIIIIFFLANLIGILSVLPGGIGSIELSTTGFLVIFGVPVALAGSIALVDRLASFWVVSVMGIIFSSIYAKDMLNEIKNQVLDIHS